MNATRRILTAGISIGMLALGVAAGPVAAAAPERVSWQDTYTVQHDCGVLETTTLTASEKAFFENGEWVRSQIHFTLEGVFTGPTGKTYAATSNQNGTFTPDRFAISGQGFFLRGAGGVLLHDTGRLVFEPSGTTIHASARALAYDDPNYPGIAEDALCARLG